MEEEQEGQDGKVWIWTRASFYFMIGLWILAMFISYEEFTPLVWIFSLLWMSSAICTFVLSIVHLTKYKEKAFAITALVISSTLNIVFFAGFIAGIIEVI